MLHNFVNTRGNTALCQINQDHFIYSNGLSLNVNVRREMSYDIIEPLSYIHSLEINDICKIGDRMIATASDKNIRIYTFNDTFRNIVNAQWFRGHDNNVNKLLLFNPNQLISVSNDRTIKFWNIQTGTCLRTIATGHGDNVIGVCKIDDNTIASSSDDSIIKLWNIQTGIEIRSLHGHTAGVTDICLLKINHILSGSRDGILRVWRISDGICTNVLRGHTGPVNTVCVLDCGLFASGSDDRTIKIWNTNLDRHIVSLGGHTKKVNKIIRTFEGNYLQLQSASIDKTVKIWAIGSGHLDEDLIANEQINTLFLLSCREANHFVLIPVLQQPRLFIDCYDDNGLNGLMHLIKNNNIAWIYNLIERGIDINAIDINGDTALHHAVRIPNNEACVRVLCENPKIISNIKNNMNEIPINICIDPVYRPLIAAIRPNLSQEECKELYLDSPWQGLTLAKIREWFDFYIDYHSGENGQNWSICLNCFAPFERNLGCIHLACQKCATQLNGEWNNFFSNRGEEIPYYTPDITTGSHLNHEGPTTQFCSVCATVCPGWDYGPATELPDLVNIHSNGPCPFLADGNWGSVGLVIPNNLPINQETGLTPTNIPYIKFYRMYKCVQKILELQPRRDITYRDARRAISDAGINIRPRDILIDQAQIDQMIQIVDNIIARRTFIPADVNMANFREGNIRNLYPSNRFNLIKNYSKVRHPKDIIANDLMSKIVRHNQTGPDEWDSEEDPFVLVTAERMIKFRHRKFTDLEIKDHENNSIEGFFARFNVVLKDPNHPDFGLCALNEQTLGNIKCDSYLYPDELGILINSGDMTHDTYIEYKSNFDNSNKFQYAVQVSATGIPIRMMYMTDEHIGGFEVWEWRWRRRWEGIGSHGS
jgi:WD40 repeat protein